jgi:NitT/TauT family transport system substrate-binding protein
MPLTRSHALKGMTSLALLPALARGAAAQAETLRVATTPIEPGCLIYYAQENGYLQNSGLTVEVTPNPSTPAIAAAVVSGTYDIGYATVSTLAVARTKGLPFVIIAPDALETQSQVQSGIVVPLHSPIQTAKDLDGVTFGTSGLNTLGEYLPRAWVDKHGGDATSMKFVEVPFPQMPDALAAGRIGAAYVVEPFLTIIEKHGIGRILNSGDDAIAPAYLAAAWFSTEQWAKAHPDVVSRFAGAMARAARWANANPAKVVPIITSYLKADPALTAASRRTYFGETLAPAQIQPIIDVTAKYGKFTSYPAADLIYVPSR